MIKQTITKVNEYVLTDDAYTGDGVFAHGDALFPHGRELEFNERKYQAFYENLVMPILDSVVDPVFGDEAQRIYDSELLEAFLGNVDNAGTSMDNFIHKITRYARLLGQAYVVMDNFESTPESMGEAIDNRAFPYVYMKKPQDVYEYSQDEFGNLTEISFYYGKDKEGNILYKGWNSTNSYIYRYDTAEEGQVQIVIKSVDHKLGVLPVVSWGVDVLPFPPYYSMSTMARAVYGTDSEMRDLTRSQGFSILVVPGQQPKDGIVIGSKNALFISIDASQTPSFIAPDSSILDGLIAYRQTLVDGILRSGDILGSTATSNGSASGVALSYRYLGTSEALKQTANVATFYDASIVSLFNLFTHQTTEYVVVYNDNYTPSFTDTKEKITSLTGVLALDMSIEVNTSVQQDIITLIGTTMGYDDEKIAELKQSVIKDIDTTSDVDGTTKALNRKEVTSTVDGVITKEVNSIEVVTQ